MMLRTSVTLLVVCDNAGAQPESHVSLVQDYTLAQYRPETFETLAYTLTIDKLVSNCGYPEVRS
jgi:hypothetical protein